MAKNFIIYVPEVGNDFAHWAMSSDAGVLVSEPGAGTLQEAAKAVEGRRSVVVVPGDDVLLAEATVPGGSASRAQQAVPYALEDMVADDIDDLHFAIGSKANGDRYPVAVIHRDTMDTLKQQLDDADLKPAEAVPETLALPKFDHQPEGPVWTALVDDDQAVIRLNGYKGFAADTDTAGMMLTGARRELEEDSVNSAMILFRTNQTEPAPDVPGMDVEVRSCESRLALYADGLAHAPRINLLQGDYSLKQQFNQSLKQWRWTVALGVLLIGLLAGSSVLDYVRLGQQEAELTTAVNDVFTDTFPGVPVRRAKTQMASRLRALGDGGGPASGFTVDMGVIASAVAAVPQTTLNSINYRDGRFDLDVTTSGLPAFDALKTNIEQNSNLSMTVQSTSLRDGGVRGRVRLEP